MPDYLLGSSAWFRIIPGGILVHRTIYDSVVIARPSFPGADGLVVALSEVFLIERIKREVLIAFELNGLVAFSQDGVVPSNL